VTRSILIESTRWKPDTSGGGMDTTLLLRGATKTISSDFERFKDRLLAAAKFSTRVISVPHDPEFTAGIVR
jgi:hypothetical protein